MKHLSGGSRMGIDQRVNLGKGIPVQRTTDRIGKRVFRWEFCKVGGQSVDVMNVRDLG